MSLKKTTPTNLDLFASHQPSAYQESIGQDAVILRHFASEISQQLVTAISQIAEQSPFRHMTTPNGKSMSVAMTNCGQFGWYSDQSGYGYSAHDPLYRKSWPTMPKIFSELAISAAQQAGFANFNPDACLINRYQIGSRLGLHQDKDEQDLSYPIVSVSLGIPATFIFGGLHRRDKTNKFQLQNGDVVIWGGASRLHFHGIATIKNNFHPFTDHFRYNLTFRHAV